MLTFTTAGVRDERAGWRDDGSCYVVVTHEDWRQNAHTFHVAPSDDGGWFVREFDGHPDRLRLHQGSETVRICRLASREQALQTANEWALAFNPLLATFNKEKEHVVTTDADKLVALRAAVKGIAERFEFEASTSSEAEAVILNGCAKWVRSLLDKPLASSAPTPKLDETCEHGTAMDVHCCHCHSGYICRRGGRELAQAAAGTNDTHAARITALRAFQRRMARRRLRPSAPPSQEPPE